MFFSIVLHGTVDENYKFINTGGYGKQSDRETFKVSSVYNMLCSNTLQIPEEDALPKTSTNMPYVFLGDEPYLVLQNLRKPYSKQQLDSDKEYFNKWLFRACRTVECAFGIIYSKWRILLKVPETDVRTANDIVKAICILHNSIIETEGTEHDLKDITKFSRQNHEEYSSWQTNSTCTTC
jgi:hypothetical protein